MRLSILDNGHRLRAKLFLTLTSAMSRVESPDIVKMLLYRPGFFSGPLLELTPDAMRGPSYWTAGEREYLAMCTAQWLQCPFCIDTHAELTRIAGEGEVNPDDPDSARPELRAARDFLAGVSKSPGHADANGVAGLPEQAVLNALQVNLVFGIIGRLANAFGFTLRGGQLHTGTRSLHRFGYRFPRFLLTEGDATSPGSDLVANLRHAVLDAPATTDPAVRNAAATGGPLPETWQSYAATVRDCSYKITDADVDRLATGHTEEEIFEITVAAAVGVALHGFEAGTAAYERKTTS